MNARRLAFLLSLRFLSWVTDLIDCEFGAHALLESDKDDLNESEIRMDWFL
jgi:hypothetical protein